MFNPVATYRLQFHKDFNFQQFESIIPYLKKLGVKTIYASPVFTSTPGSTHGYDALNANEVNPEIGTEEKLRVLSQKLKMEGIGWLQDIVPNHMAYDTRNPWVMDLLEKGPQSVYSKFFDTTWSGDLFEGRIMVPFLGHSLENVIGKGALTIGYKEPRFVFYYDEVHYPLNPRSYLWLLEESKGPQAIQQLKRQVQLIHQTENPKAFAEQWDEFLLQLEGLMRNKIIRRSVEEAILKINSDPEKLWQLANDQTYRLCHWQETDYQINYRRFFTVNGLICLNIQNEEVLEGYHGLIHSLIRDSVFQGLRIDHIDGLYDPAKYLQQLRQKIADDPYVLVEKILEPGESLPRHWPVQGNTGYDFLSLVNNLLTDQTSEESFTQFYYALTNNHQSVPQQMRDKKSLILYEYMCGELKNLYHMFMESELVSPEDYAQMRTEDIETAIAEFLIHCPVYRYYGNRLPLNDEETKSIQNILEQAKTSRPDLEPAFHLLAQAMLYRPRNNDEDYNTRALHFYQRLMQYTGPLMAKGVEDTLMYTFNLFIAHNEVGDSPGSFGLSVNEFHAAMTERQKKWPLSLNATATHDTKRGEDVRARLNVLTEMADDWLNAVKKWRRINAPLKKDDAPDNNDEYFIYQTLMGTYPMEEEEEHDYRERLLEYLQKAMREAKSHSNWSNPNEEYEKATEAFVLALLNKAHVFWNSFQNFHQHIIDFGIINSLVQTTLKFTCPGVPDVYQGSELWDFSFVDPDNRRPVDYERRTALQESIEKKKGEKSFFQLLWNERYSAQIKLWLTQQLFLLRGNYSNLLSKGEYIPLKTEGQYKDHVLAFARKQQRTWILTAVPLHIVQMCRKQEKQPPDLDWSDTKIILPQTMTDHWEDLFSGAKNIYEKEITVQHLFHPLPLAVLKTKEPVTERGAGILLHITSLPSAFATGDLGPEAYAFADFLNNSHQRFWQLLPLNPVEKSQFYSPYSSISSRAGNPLLISPELLVKENLLREDDISGYRLPPQSNTNYAEAERIRSQLFDIAYHQFKTGFFKELQQQFEQFCEQEKLWLNDFALYLVLKKNHGQKPWYEWPEPFKLKEQEVLHKVQQDQNGEIEKIKWIQFVFDRQWKELKTYCNELDIQLIGDLPIYVSYDSADVWAHRDIFYLDPEGQRLGLAGVPPDAFSDDGQLWGMPTYRWDVLKQRNYDWWIDRLKKNASLFNLIRLDHFRAFADYWEVPAGEKTAKHGKWKPGPGAHFFETVNKSLGSLPFIAEDLGEVNQAVFDLRDQFGLPGMKIIQFAFGNNLPRSEHAPHNYTKSFVVYTGTHDNNTVLGWFRHEAPEVNKALLGEYTDQEISEDKVPWLLCRLAYASVANMVILPLQDVLQLDESARMNTPSSAENNWSWRFLPGQINASHEERLKKWTWLYNRE